jgi:dolichol-phosphate mannosyltransferase
VACDRGRPTTGPTLVIIPTYNDAGNIRTVIRRVRSAVPDADALVVDDDSPDGNREHRGAARHRT